MLIDPQRTFESLLVSPTNLPALRAVQRAITAVSSRPNPLLIIGPTASGKTHLLHAAANSLTVTHPAHSIQLLTAETFRNAFVTDIMAGRMRTFRHGLRVSAALLVDGMEDHATREATQEEFHNNIHNLVERGRTVILTLGNTDREYRALLTERIHSFPRGLAVRWHPAPIPVRIAAMQRILRARKQRMPVRALVQLAQRAPTIPEASAALHRALLGVAA